MVSADMHVHVTGDTADTPQRILQAAKAQNLSTLVITDHDSTQSYQVCEEINQREELGLQLIPGVESTTLVDGKKASRWQPKHVLVYGITKAPPCYMPVDELNALVHAEGGYTSVAHPGLGRFSLTQREIMEIQDRAEETQHFDFAEVHNGGVSLLQRFAVRHPYLTRGLVRAKLMPEAENHNEKNQTFVHRMKQKLHLSGVTAGSDSHDARHVGEVALFYDQKIGLFESIKAGKTAIGEKKKLLSTTAKSVVLGTVGGWRLEISRRFATGWNGITVYDRSKAPQ